ncbi:MAG: GNAT family N-acetyltransferase [Acidimicrobiia bacterium]|nr:GNAT family N-acetyltransferase [Acidimicrobiia bacterium]
MQITVRSAADADLSTIIGLYERAEAEQTAKKPIWALTDGLDESFEDSLKAALAADESWISIGCIDGTPVGFIWATIEPMLRRAGGERTGRIRLVYTDPDARGVGVGHAMLESMMGVLRSRGIRHFDAPVGPGQRLTKNFFEGHEFAARSIIMYHADEDDA